MATPAKTKAAAPAAPAVQTDSRAKYVTVASKLPMSIELQLCRPTVAKSTGRWGTSEETIMVKTGAVYVIRGIGYPSGEPPKGYPRRPKIVGVEDDRDPQGYATTPKIPADWWAKWLEQNKDTDMVQAGLIFAMADLDDLAAKATENLAVDSGLGPVIQEGDKRSPKPINALIQPIETAERTI